MVNGSPQAAARFHGCTTLVRDRSATRQKPLARVIRLRKHRPLAIVFPPAVGVMLVWIFIAACWAGLLLLILHDVTKDAAGSSAVSVASRSALFTAAKGWRRLRRLKRYATSLKASPKASPKVTPEASPTAARAQPVRSSRSSRPGNCPLAGDGAFQKNMVAQGPSRADYPCRTGIDDRRDDQKNGAGMRQLCRSDRSSQEAEAISRSELGRSRRKIRKGRQTDRRRDSRPYRQQLQKEFRLTDPQLRN